MKKFISTRSLFLFISLIFYACTPEDPTLIDWSKEYIANGLEVDDTDREPAKEDYFTVQTKEDTIIATALMLDHCVDKPIAVIEFKNEIIYLSTKNTMAAEQYCPEYYKYTYIIHNPSKVNYQILTK